MNKIEKLMSMRGKLLAHYQYDDKEQYSRHSCLRIHRIECSDDERNANVLQRVKEC